MPNVAHAVWLVGKMSDVKMSYKSICLDFQKIAAGSRAITLAPPDNEDLIVSPDQEDLASSGHEGYVEDLNQELDPKDSAEKPIPESTKAAATDPDFTIDFGNPNVKHFLDFFVEPVCISV